MSFQSFRKLTVAVLAATGVLAVAVAGGYALGVPKASASEQISKGLGIGSRVAPTVSLAVSGVEKVPQADEAPSAALVTAVSRKHAPVPKARVAKAPGSSSRAKSGSSSRSGASSSGWQSARASWYGPGFYGNTMAGGGTLQRDSMVVAHRSLPFGTRIQFQYNGRSCTAVVMDRGPYAGGRVFDLGPGTAKALGFSGVGTVKYRILGR